MTKDQAFQKALHLNAVVEYARTEHETDITSYPVRFLKESRNGLSRFTGKTVKDFLDTHQDEDELVVQAPDGKFSVLEIQYISRYSDHVMFVVTDQPRSETTGDPQAIVGSAIA